jgi:hypothetical protein
MTDLPVSELPDSTSNTDAQPDIQPIEQRLGNHRTPDSRTVLATGRVPRIRERTANPHASSTGSDSRAAG